MFVSLGANYSQNIHKDLNKGYASFRGFSVSLLRFGWVSKSGTHTHCINLLEGGQVYFYDSDGERIKLMDKEGSKEITLESDKREASYSYAYNFINTGRFRIGIGSRIGLISLSEVHSDKYLISNKSEFEKKYNMKSFIHPYISFEYFIKPRTSISVDIGVSLPSMIPSAGVFFRWYGLMGK